MFYLSENTLKLSRYFFKGALLYPCINFFKKFLLKKYKARQSYVIISPLYNCAKYLDDFLLSIINQRLDFKRNITLILVDDGSNDESFFIIKKYLKKYPKNIHYIYKENGGVSSARNLGLSYLKKSDIKATFINFADSDDILDRNFFYEMDKFLGKEKDENLAMLCANFIFYREKRIVRYKDSHSLNFKFKKTCVKDIKNLDNFIQINTNSVLFKKEFLDDKLHFEKDLSYGEDSIFVLNFFLLNYYKKVAFLKEAKYFYRKRFNKSSILDSASYKVKYKLIYSSFLEDILYKYKKNLGFIPSFLSNTVLYNIFWLVDELSNVKNDEIKSLNLSLYLRKIFTLLPDEHIANFKLCGIKHFHKIGFFHLFKNENLRAKQRVFIENLDEKKDELLLSFFYSKNYENFLKNSKITAEKIRKISFLDEDFVYEKRLWVKVDEAFKKDFDFRTFILEFKGKELKNLDPLYKELKKLKGKRARNDKIWLFADSNLRADDNAEHLYRYLRHKRIDKKIYFVLSKKSEDFKRLFDEGFNLVDLNSFKFLYLLFRADKIISSHIDRYFYGAFGKNTLLTKDFVFLQHGISEKDISAWLNTRKIDLLITSAKPEFQSFVCDYTAYKLSKKEVKLTGFARHDRLISLKKEKKYILIMPTWRRDIVGAFSKKLGTRRINKNFTQSLYFKKYNELLSSYELLSFCEKNSYELCFNPHPNILPYLNFFRLDKGIKLANGKNLQELFAKTALLITDYSSVAFDVAKLSKPVLYYHFDKESFFLTQWQSGYFDYEKDGFGAVCKNLNELLAELYKNEKCEFKEPFLSRTKAFFAFNDGKNCERIYKEILSLDL
ncbi:bifunctional glycosyltransferase/CDP-glycerol:glycerophosphate glycerophosphotransferase [Campylobacter avium]|uniref:bifunctional glycosyltransferase/CDP-glycerol:glycerophosphate glycerophosphotransferase n=1 Tax=Campylobacter avium TaxID=522485 RepID=UPI00255BF462|nr:CDP-glycerol glycerophosphotransferase family protein [Campylobacter avium]